MISKDDLSLISTEKLPSMKYERLSRAVIGDWGKGMDPFGYCMQEVFTNGTLSLDSDSVDQEDEESSLELKKAMSLIVSLLTLSCTDEKGIMSGYEDQVNELVSLEKKCWAVANGIGMTQILKEVITLCEQLVDKDCISNT